MGVRVGIGDALRQIGILSSTLPQLLDDEFAGRDVVEAYAELNREYFDSAGNGMWPPLTERTIAFKRATGLPLAPLVRSGRLRAAVTAPFGLGSADVEIDFGGSEIRWALRGPPYARLMHTDLGGVIARPLFDTGDQVDDRIATAIEEYLEENV